MSYKILDNRDIDLNYNPKSENPQSGKAVAEGIANMVNSAPETLDTLNELAAALGNDANFAATVAEQIGKKADKTELENFVTEEQVEAQIALANEEFLLDNSEKYKIVDELPMMLSEVNQSEMYLIKEDIGYNKYIYNELEEKITEASSIWDGTLIIPEKNNEGVYIIDSAEKLAYVIYYGGSVDGKMDNTFLITKDIYLNDINKINWTTGTAVSGYTANRWYSNNTEAGQRANSAFSGTIDGGYHTIHGIYIPYKWSFSGVATDNGAGFIAGTASNSNTIIKNLNIDNAFIKSRGHTGGIIGITKGTVNIDSCSVGANVHLGGSSVGAIRAGGRSDYSVVTVNNCYSLADLNLTDSTGASTTIKGLFGYFWDKTINISSSFNGNGPICSTDYNKTKIKNCYATEEIVALEGATIITAENMQGLDTLTNSEKMPLLNEHIFKPTESYPTFKFATFGMVKVDDAITKEYVNQITDEINNKINGIKGKIEGVSIEINDVSSIPHYIKCLVEQEKDFGENLVFEDLPSDHELVFNLSGDGVPMNITCASIAHLEKNKYYYISVQYKENIVAPNGQIIYLDDSAYAGIGSPYIFQNNHQTTQETVNEYINTLFILRTKASDIEKVVIKVVENPNETPIDITEVIVTVTDNLNNIETYNPDSNGIVKNIKSTYPIIIIGNNANLNMTCEYVKDTQFADVIGMIVPRYIDDNNI